MLWNLAIAVSSAILYIVIWGPFYSRGLTLIPAWISNYIHYEM